MKTTSKHAYCIMAHGGWEQLQMLLDVLDDARNDIFLHIDAKSIASFENIGGAYQVAILQTLLCEKCRCEMERYNASRC